MKQKVTNIKKNEREEKVLEINVGRLLQPNFLEAIRKLIKIPMKNDQGMKVKRGVVKIEAAINAYNKAKLEVLNKYCEKNEAGEILFEDADKKFHKILPDKAQMFDADMEVLASQTILIPTIHASAILGADVSPEFLLILDGLILEG